MKSKRRDYVVTIKVKSLTGEPPVVRVLCGDTIFCTLTHDGQSATFTTRKLPAGVSAWRRA
jgi:hypothetical protein